MTDVRISSAGQNVSSLALVTADQVTILGDGSVENPLRAVTTVESANEFNGRLFSDVGFLGAAVYFDDGDLQLATSEQGLNEAAVVGLVVAFPGGTPLVQVTVRSRGLVELTTAQWDVVTGQTGGLTVAAVYFLSRSFSATPGQLSTGAGSGSDNVAQVGVALNATTMLVGLPATPTEGLI